MDKPAFDQWLDVSDQEILKRWYSSGLDYAGNDVEQPLRKVLVEQIGQRVAQACLSLDDPAVFWQSYPFYTHDLHTYKREDRLNRLESALSHPGFQDWFLAHLSRENKELLLDAWWRLGNDINCLDEAWSHRSERGDRPRLAAICTDLYLARHPDIMPGQEAWIRWIGVTPRHEATHQVAETRMSEHVSNKLHAIAEAAREGVRPAPRARGM